MLFRNKNSLIKFHELKKVTLTMEAKTMMCCQGNIGQNFLLISVKPDI